MVEAEDDRLLRRLDDAPGDLFHLVERDFGGFARGVNVVDGKTTTTYVYAKK